MNSEDFRNLIRDFCNEVGLPNERPTFEVTHFKVGDFQTTLFFDAAVRADTIFVYIDVAELAPHLEHEAYRSMLESNLSSADGVQIVLGVHPNTGHAVMASRIPFTPSLTGSEVSELVEGYCNRAEEFCSKVLAYQ